jgi:hypothetical protein
MARGWVAALLLVGLSLRLAVAWAPFDPWQLTRGPLVDDSFYYFQIARNIAAGAGPTHDGLALTSGFQPLWAFLLVPIWQLAGDDPLRPIRYAMTLSAVIGALTGLGIWRLVRRLAGAAGATFALTLWCLSPYAIEHGMNGMETGLAACLLVWTVEHYVAHIRAPAGPPAAWAWVTAGLLAAGCYLARADGAILVAALAVDALRRPRAWRWPGGGLAAAVAITVCVPWVSWCWVLGSLLPESGFATRRLAMLFAEVGAYNAHPVGAAFYLDNALAIARHVLAQPLVPLPGIPIGYALHWGLGGALATWLTVALYAILAALTRWGPLRRILPPGRFPAFLWVWAGLAVAAYVFALPAQWSYDRYAFGLTALGLVLSGVVFQGVAESLSRRRFAAFAALTLAGVGLVSARQAQVLFGRSDGDSVQRYVELAWILRDNPRIPEPIAVLQSGTVGYFSGRSVLALDGVVNGDAAAALRDRRLYTFLRSRGVVFVADVYPWMVEAVLERASEGEPRPSLARVPLDLGETPDGLGVWLKWPDAEP